MEKRDILEPLTKIYQRCKSKMPPIKALPPTSPNFSLHRKRAYLRVMMWKAAAKRAPPTAVADISKFGSVWWAMWCSIHTSYSYRLTTTSSSYERTVMWVQVRAGMCRRSVWLSSKAHTMHHTLQIYRIVCSRQCGQISRYRR